MSNKSSLKYMMITKYLLVFLIGIYKYILIVFIIRLRVVSWPASMWTSALVFAEDDGIDPSEGAHGALATRAKSRASQLQLVVAWNLDKGTPAENPLEACPEPAAKKKINLCHVVTVLCTNTAFTCWCFTFFYSPAVEAAVDDGVVHGGAHGQPHDGQVNLLDEPFFKQDGKGLIQQEEDVVGQPADGKRTHHHDHHLHHLLGTQQRFVYCVNFASVVLYFRKDLCCRLSKRLSATILS